MLTTPRLVFIRGQFQNSRQASPLFFIFDSPPPPPRGRFWNTTMDVTWVVLLPSRVSSLISVLSVASWRNGPGAIFVSTTVPYSSALASTSAAILVSVACIQFVITATVSHFVQKCYKETQRGPSLQK